MKVVISNFYCLVSNGLMCKSLASLLLSLLLFAHWTAGNRSYFLLPITLMLEYLDMPNELSSSSSHYSTSSIIIIIIVNVVLLIIVAVTKARNDSNN